MSIHGKWICTDCGRTFEWTRLIRNHYSDGKPFTVTTINDRQTLLNDNVQFINGTECFDCYCPKCGFPNYIPCSLCNTDS